MCKEAAGFSRIRAVEKKGVFGASSITKIANFSPKAKHCSPLHYFLPELLRRSTSKTWESYEFSFASKIHNQCFCLQRILSLLRKTQGDPFLTRIAPSKKRRAATVYSTPENFFTCHWGRTIIICERTCGCYCWSALHFYRFTPLKVIKPRSQNTPIPKLQHHHKQKHFFVGKNLKKITFVNYFGSGSIFFCIHRWQVKQETSYIARLPSIVSPTRLQLAHCVISRKKEHKNTCVIPSCVSRH